MTVNRHMTMCVANFAARVNITQNYHCLLKFRKFRRMCLWPVSLIADPDNEYSSKSTKFQGKLRWGWIGGIKSGVDTGQVACADRVMVANKLSESLEALMTVLVQ